MVPFNEGKRHVVVEDEALLRMMAVEIAEEAGFDVIETSNADDAIGILESREDIRIVFTDIDMPGSMNGLKLAAAVRDRWPPIEIIVVSGYVRPEHPISLPGASFSENPTTSGRSSPHSVTLADKDRGDILTETLEEGSTYCNCYHKNAPGGFTKF